jgi:acetyl esterase/lipase
MRTWILSLLTTAALSSSLLAQTPAAKPAPRKQIIEELTAKLEPTRTVVYKRIGDRELKLDIFEPAGHKPSDRRACFVGIHGGGWTGGDTRRMYTYADHFAKLGLVGVSLQYRLLDKAKTVTPFECVKDGRSAIRYLKAHAAELGIDPEKIVVSGGSAGGHVAAGTALFDGVDDEIDDLKISPTPAALVLLYPVIDTGPQGYGNAKCGPKWKDISPVDHVRAKLPPTLVFHGTGDTVTPFAGAKRFAEEMLQAGNRCELVVHEGGVHGYFLYDQKLYDEAVRRMDAFLVSLKLLDAPASLQP